MTKNFLIATIGLMFLLFLSSCASQIDENQVNSRLKQCYEEKCELIVENLELDYPIFEYCPYEFRKKCIDEINSKIDSNFCDEFTYSKLCYEDLAVISKNKDLCYETVKPSKDDDLFKQYIEMYPEKNPEELFEEYSKEVLEYNQELNNCGRYYDQAMKVIDDKISFCADTHPGESDSYRCYPKLIKSFEDVSECDYYEDFKEHKTVFDMEYKYGEENKQCYGWYAGLRKDISICQNMKTEVKKARCLNTFAHLNRDPSFCDDISDARIRDLCISNAKEVPKYCEEYLPKEVCKKEILDYSNINVCDRFTDSMEKSECTTNVANYIVNNMAGDDDYCLNNEDPAICIQNVSLIIEGFKPKLAVNIYFKTEGFTVDLKSTLCKGSLDSLQKTNPPFSECKMSFNTGYSLNVGSHTYVLDYQDSEEWTQYVKEGGFLTVPYFRIDQVYDSKKGFAKVSQLEFNSKDIEIIY